MRYPISRINLFLAMPTYFTSLDQEQADMCAPLLRRPYLPLARNLSAIHALEPINAMHQKCCRPLLWPWVLKQRAILLEQYPSSAASTPPS